MADYYKTVFLFTGKSMQMSQSMSLPLRCLFNASLTENRNIYTVITTVGEDVNIKIGTLNLIAIPFNVKPLFSRSNRTQALNMGNSRTTFFLCVFINWFMRVPRCKLVFKTWFQKYLSCLRIVFLFAMTFICRWMLAFPVIETLFTDRKTMLRTIQTHTIPSPNFADVSVSLCQSRIRPQTPSMYTGPSWNKRHQGHVSRSLYQLPIPVAIPLTTYTGTLSNTNDKRHHHNGVQSSSSGV